VVRGLMNEMDQWIENKNYYFLKAMSRELGST
jgi:hypothetical protein